MAIKNRWIILVACVVVNLCFGAGYAWSVFQRPLMKNFNWSIGQASLAFSISFAMVPIAMIIFGPRQDKEGPRKITFIGGLLFGLGMILTGFVNNIILLYLTYGLILGFGIGMGYGCTTATTVKWFPDRKGFAGGLIAAGFGLGAVILAPIAANMIDSLGVLMTFRVLSFILLIIICAMSLLISAPEKLSLNNSVSEVDATSKQMMKMPHFCILWLTYIFACLSDMMIIGHASPIANEYLELSKQIATLTVSLLALANTGGRIFWGFISDRVGRYYAAMMMFVVSILGLLLLIFKDIGVVSVSGIILIGLCFGGFFGIYPGITVENWGPKNAGSNYGFMFSAYGIAAIFGPGLAASIKQSQGGNYSMAFIVSLVLCLFGILLVLIFRGYKKKVKF